MKNIFQLLVACFLFVLALPACKKEENKIYFDGASKTPELTSSVASLVLNEDDAEKHLVDFNWTNPDYLFTTGVSSQDVSYLIEIDEEGKGFSGPNKYQIAIERELKKSFTVGEFNELLIQRLKLEAEVAKTIEIRVIASLKNIEATKTVSNALSFSVTPYSTVIKIFYLYTPGNYWDPNWSPAESPKLGSLDESVYEGYVYFNKENGNFKFTAQPNWDGPNYGAGSAANTLSDTGGDISFTGTGMYRFKVNLGELNWSSEITNWGLIGDATPGGWDNSTPFVYDAATKKLIIASVPLTANKFKFRANNEWVINLGGDADNPDFLKYGGADIPVSAAGNYKVELDLNNPLQYTYKLTKL